MTEFLESHDIAFVYIVLQNDVPVLHALTSCPPKLPALLSDAVDWICGLGVRRESQAWEWRQTIAFQRTEGVTVYVVRICVAVIFDKHVLEFTAGLQTPANSVWPEAMTGQKKSADSIESDASIMLPSIHW